MTRRKGLERPASGRAEPWRPPPGTASGIAGLRMESPRAASSLLRPDHRASLPHHLLSLWFPDSSYSPQMPWPRGSVGRSPPTLPCWAELVPEHEPGQVGH